MMSGVQPIDRHFTATEIDLLFSSLVAARRIGIAVSGGPDSIALLLLADAWIARRPDAPTLTVLTVDHALRATSSDEADAVVAFAGHLGHDARKLVWQHANPITSDIEAEAREARYALLVAEARRLGLDAVLLAHTIDDQAETFLMRLQRGSGVRGLAAMSARRVVDGVPFLRPLLGVPKTRLVAMLDDLGIAYVSDPTNRSERFLRARFRALMPTLAAVGLDAHRLAGTAKRMARADAALSIMTDALADAAVTPLNGVVRVDVDRLRAAPDEIALRLISRLLRAVRPTAYPPRIEAPERWLTALRQDRPPRRATMAGVVLDVRRSGLWFYAEAGRTGLPTLSMTGDGVLIWDDRFSIEITGSMGGRVAIGPASGESLRTDMPKAAAASLPVVSSVGERLPPGFQATLHWLGSSLGTDGEPP